MDCFNIGIVSPVLKITQSCLWRHHCVMCNTNWFWFAFCSWMLWGRHPKGSGMAQVARGLPGLAEIWDPKQPSPWEGSCRHSPGLIATLALRRLSRRGLG